jgi:DNA-binding transcriptional LysR family regulator
MDIRLLKMFRAVATLGGMPAASKQLHVTTSALSHGLKALETELGTRLFDRVGNKLLLNQAGEQLLAQTEGPLIALEHAAASIRALGRWGQSTLRVGASVSACQHILPAVFRELRKESPKVVLQVRSADTPQLVELLRQNRIDIALGPSAAASPDLELRPLFEDELMFVLSPDHPWVDGRALSKEDIARQQLIVYQSGSATNQLVDDYFREQSIAPTSAMEIGSITGIKEMVKLNLGVAILAPWVVEAELTRGVLKMRPLGAKVLKRSWVMTHLAGKRLGMMEETFYQICRRHCSGLRVDRKDLPERGKVGKA